MKAQIKRVWMEPELEVVAGGLCPVERLLLARKFDRWARQLRVSAEVMRPLPERQRQRLRPLAWRMAKLN